LGIADLSVEDFTEQRAWEAFYQMLANKRSGEPTNYDKVKDLLFLPEFDSKKK
jgi:hypothetical protein